MSKNKTCVIIGASHAGVNLAFSLRKEGWEGEIHLFDADPVLPYHRPPLSKAYLTSDDPIEQNALKAVETYERENINLHLGVQVEAIDKVSKFVSLSNNTTKSYDKLVIATGASPIIPPIVGIETAHQLYPLRTAKDVTDIKKAMLNSTEKRVVVIGAGYIGLETAASLKKLGATVSVLEREERILQRVTSPVMSNFFQELHTKNNVDVLTTKDVVLIETSNKVNTIHCSDGSKYTADIIIVGVGVRVNKQLADAIGAKIDNGIKVDETTATSIDDVYAIGDCSFHFNPHYNRFIRLESVQNAVDQAKVTAAAICGKSPVYNTIPWFWSDQYDIKLQMVGLSNGYTETIVRHEEGEATKFSVWYFKGDDLLAVDAVNNAKAYVIGTKFIKTLTKVNKAKLADTNEPLKPATLKL